MNHPDKKSKTSYFIREFTLTQFIFIGNHFHEKR